MCRHVFLALMTVLVLGACASTPPAPVDDLSEGRRTSTHGSTGRSVPAGSYKVRRGDTLYSIAFRNGLDYRDVARANGIGPPYTIYVGQVIRLDGRSGASRASASASKPRSAPKSPSPQRPSTSPKKPATSAAAASNPAPAPTQTAPAPAAQAPRPVSASPAATASNAGISWRWPASGSLITGYIAGDQTRQGINIAGKAGDPVRSAADGEVVYSGNGLIGYGELIIVKHSTTMLSAYGHNRRRLVQEGDTVKAGQQIAEMGSSSASRDMLHFEIRKNGKPVDPLAYLPGK
ncbi:peptidoglycan DD-metalloendopeptidase family protein [Dokdonella sp.]|uniref:peptidoglycan DD-metalloendopeptidase family protein n=1 Tax=Dokdonella sp. TaxID=2291710 RepID=UPI003527014F